MRVGVKFQVSKRDEEEVQEIWEKIVKLGKYRKNFHIFSILFRLIL